MSRTSHRKLTLNLSEVAPLLGMSKSTVYTAAREGNLPFPVLRVNSRYVVPAKPFFEALGQIPEGVA